MFTLTLPRVQLTMRPILMWKLNAVKAQIRNAERQQKSETDEEVWEDRDIQINELSKSKEALEERLGIA